MRSSSYGLIVRESIPDLKSVDLSLASKAGNYSLVTSFVSSMGVQVKFRGRTEAGHPIRPASPDLTGPSLVVPVCHPKPSPRPSPGPVFQSITTILTSSSPAQSEANPPVHKLWSGLVSSNDLFVPRLLTRVSSLITNVPNPSSLPSRES